MKLIFAGTPEFAVPTLKALCEAGHHVSLVLTQPDRPSGRGLKLQSSPIKRAAETRKIPIYQPASLKAAEPQARLAAEEADAMIVVAYGLLLPPPVLTLPRFGCINLHASLLPRWRGAAPIHRALLAGDRETGVAIMAMDAGLDTGPVYRFERLQVADRDTTGTLHDRLSVLGAEALIKVLADLEAGRATATPQSETGTRYAPKIDKREAVIDWTREAVLIDRQIRAFDPFPGALASLGGSTCKLWKSEIRNGTEPNPEPGTIVAVDSEYLIIACGRGHLAVAEIQLAGGRRLRIRDFLAGHSLSAGDRFARLPAA